jgi:voltage-gated potassium channel
LYWSVTTMTTTGYGDIRASTTLGRMVAIAVMLLGQLLFAVVLGTPPPKTA